MFVKAALVVLLAVVGDSFPTKEATDKYYWSWSHENVIECPDPVKAGITYNGTIAYVSRAHKGKDVFPGFTDIEEVNGTIYLLDDKPVKSTIYEVLCGTGIAWRFYDAGKNQTFPKNAIPVGQQSGKDLYACRAPLNGWVGNYVSGYIDLKLNACLLPMSFGDLKYDWETFSYQYEVLIEAPAQKSDEKTDIHWEWASLYYKPCEKDSVKAGLGTLALDKNKDVLYPARSHSFDALIPGLGTTYSNYFAEAEQVLSASTYEIMCGTNVAWQPIDTTVLDIPETAIPVGFSGNGTLYSCKLVVPGKSGLVTLGFVDPSTKKCVSPALDVDLHYTKVESSSSFEVMISP